MAKDAGKDFTSGKGFEGLAKELKEAFQAAVIPDTTIQQLTAIETQVMTIQKGLTDGVVVGAEKFRQRLTDVYISTQGIGASFKDVTELASGLGTNLGKAVTPSQETLKAMVEFGKATGISNAEISTTMSSFVKLGNSQTESLKIMQDITKEARMAGIDAQSVIKDVTDNLTKVSTLGFSKGVDGLQGMAAQAKSLNTSVQEIGALKLAESLWDPKKAVDLAQKFQMIGADVGNLSNFNELMRMGAYDVEGLQTAMLDTLAAQYELNEATGKFELKGDQLGRQQFKAIASAMEVSSDQAAKMGIELAKQKEIEEKILESKTLKGKFNADEMKLIQNLSQIGPGGKIELSIPGFDAIPDLTQLNSQGVANLQKSLKEYQDKAKLEDKDIAIKNLTVTERQEIAVQAIKETLLRSLTDTEREKVLKAAGTVKDTAQAGYQTLSTNVINDLGIKGMITDSADFISILRAQLSKDEPTPAEISAWQKKNNDGIPTTGGGQYGTEVKQDYLSTEQPFTGSKLITGNKGYVEDIIFDKEDDFLAAPKLNEILNKAKMSFDSVYALNEIAAKPLPEKIPKINDSVTKIETNINNNTTNTTEIKFDPIVIKIEGVEGTLKQILEKGENANLLNEKIQQEFAKMPKLMKSKGVFGY